MSGSPVSQLSAFVRPPLAEERLPTVKAADLLVEIERLPEEQLPAVLLVLAACLAKTSARLLSGSTTNPTTRAQVDENLSVDQAAQRLGVSPDWLYRNHKRLPFTRRIGRRLLFSSRGLERWNTRPR